MIHEYGARPHQRGGLSVNHNMGPKGARYHLPSDYNDTQVLYGPVRVLVQNGKPVNSAGAELIRRFKARPQ